ncbi:MAG: sodium:solute symporter family protein [Bacteroidota bacterium]
MLSWLNLDIVIFSCFLATNLVLGLQAGRRVKNVHTYAIGNKDFPTATLTSTIVATWIGGGVMFYGLGRTYNTGLYFAIALSAASLGLLITGRFLVVRMGEFLNNLSVAEAMGDLYGKTVRIATALSGIALSIGGVAIQFQVIGKMLTLIFGFQGPEVTVAAASIVILYSAFGGIRSVTITDVFQFITFGVFIPVLSLIVWNNLQDPDLVVHTLTTNPMFDPRAVMGWNPKFLSSLSLLLYWAIPGINPPAFQRLAMARDLGQAQRSFTYAAGLSFLVIISVVWVAILVLVENPNLQPESKPEVVFNYLIDRYTYAGFKGLVAVGMVAMAMSTADSDLNSSAVLAVHDIITPLQPSAKTSITTVRLLSLAAGLLSLLLALHAEDIVELMLFSGSLYMPVVTVPFLLALFGFRSSARAVLIGMLAGISTVLVWRQLMAHTGIDPVITGMISNLVFFMGSHYLLREAGGWVGIKVPGPLIAARQEQRVAWRSFFNTILHPRLYAYLKSNLPAKEGLYSLFGLYVIGATYASFSTVPATIVNTNFFYFIAQSVLLATTLFITYPAWPPTFRSKRFIAFAWPLGIGYILFLAGGVLVLMSGFHQVQAMIFMLNLVMAALLLDWPLMVFLAVSGIVLALGIFQRYVGAIPWADIWGYAVPGYLWAAFVHKLVGGLGPI